MKLVRNIILLSLFLVLISCSGGAGNQGIVILDESLRMGPNAIIENPGIANRELSIIHFPGAAKVALLPGLLIIDVVDDSGLQAFLKKYDAVVVADPEIKLFAGTRLSRNGVTELKSTEQIIRLNLSIAGESDLAFFAKSSEMPLPLAASDQKAIQFLNLLAKMKIEDLKKLRDFRPAVFSYEPDAADASKNLAFPDWADCGCLEKDASEPDGLRLRYGATWNGEQRFAPVHNPFLPKSGGRHCTYVDGLASDSSYTLQGQNVLIVNFATMYHNYEFNIGGDTGLVHMWAFPTKHLPIEIPAHLEKNVPEGANDVVLRGPATDICEWLAPDQEQYIAYQNFILWHWDRSDPADEVALLLWEGDDCLSLRLFQICNPDDKIALVVLNRNGTLDPDGITIHDRDVEAPNIRVEDLNLNVRGFDMNVKTIDFCRNNGFSPDIFETCNGYDDTCDGEVDEGFPIKEPCDNGQVGQCRAEGSFICSSVKLQREGGPLVVCNTPLRSASPFEICDNIDNDCDGAIDEDWIQQGLACGLGVGTCGVGALGCSSGQISCEGEITPQVEICDGLDNDCDGVTDEGCNCNLGDRRECSIDLGPCSKGTQQCIAGSWSDTCGGGTVPEVEVCDYIDNNCNSAVDEGLLNRCGDCGPEPIEICDGIDNDCDGAVDEGVTDCCNGQIKQPEVCDNIDNDCDGSIDETENPVVCGIGRCEKTVVSVCTECIPGNPDGPNEIFDLTCDDGIDNDCDGLKDIEDTEDCFELQGGGG